MKKVKPVEGPFYPLNEALVELKISKTEFAHLVQTDQIELVVFTKSRKFLIFHRKDEGWVGHATCDYRGHLTLHRNSIKNLFDGDQLVMDSGSGRLLESSGISRWSADYPFDQPLPIDPLTHWEPIEEATLYEAVTPFPKEAKSFAHGMADMANQIIRARAHLYPDDETSEENLKNHIIEGADKLTLFFNENSKFNPEDLRVPASSITKLLRGPNSRRPRGKVLKKKTYFAGQKLNLFHELVSRIVTDHPKISAPQAWKIIIEECRTDEPVFNTDYILEQGDAGSIDWNNRSGVIKTTKYASFPNIMTKVRKKLK